ncbi:MAG: hypothetical protein AB1Z98_16330 [Nannocystaceae bacterium]
MRRRPIETTAVADALRAILEANARAAAEENVLIARDEAGGLHPYSFALQQRMREEGGSGTRIRVDELVDRAMAEAMKVWEQVNPSKNARDHRWLALDEVAAITAIDPLVGSLTEQALQDARAARGDGEGDDDDDSVDVVATLRAFFDAFDFSTWSPDDQSLPDGERVDARPGQPRRSEPPEGAVEAFDFFYRIELGDFGSVSLHRGVIDGLAVWMVYATTDGDDAYFEVLDAEGNTLDGARLQGNAIIAYDEFPQRVRLSTLFTQLERYANEEGLSEPDERAAAGQPPMDWPGEAVLDDARVFPASGGRNLGRIDLGEPSLPDRLRDLAVAAIEQLWALPLQQQVNGDEPVRLGPTGQGVLSVGSFTRPTDGQTYEVANYRDIDDASFVYYYLRGELGLQLAILQFDN